MNEGRLNPSQVNRKTKYTEVLYKVPFFLSDENGGAPVFKFLAYNTHSYDFN